MKVLFEKKFLKDLVSLNNKNLKQRIEQIIVEIENSPTFEYLSNCKKLEGHKSAYRIRFGEYRLGFFVENQTVIFTRFMHRKEIYRYFSENFLIFKTHFYEKFYFNVQGTMYNFTKTAAAAFALLLLLCTYANAQNCDISFAE